MAALTDLFFSFTQLYLCFEELHKYMVNSNSHHLVTVRKKNYLLTGRNLQKNQAQRGRRDKRQAVEESHRLIIIND